MALDRNSPAFAHHNVKHTVKPIEGSNRGRILSLDAVESCKADVGNKVTHLKGSGAGPLSVVSGGAEPSGEIKFSTNIESAQMAKHIGNVHNRFTYTVTMTRVGLQRHTYTLKNCMVEKGFGFESGHDSGPNDTVSFKCTDITLKVGNGKEFSLVHEEPGGATGGGGGGGFSLNIGFSL
jgi:hypothetical protein